MKNNIINLAKQYIMELFKDNFDGHDVEHSMRVYHNALELADTEPKCDRMTVALAALLHDVDDHKLFSTENNENARRFLMNHEVDNMQIEKICNIINGVSFSKNRGKQPETLEGKIVQDADRLDAMGAIGIARTFAYGGKHGRPISHSVRHFEEKLLHLKGEMNTTKGKQIAKERHAFLVMFISELEKEKVSIEKRS